MEIAEILDELSYAVGEFPQAAVAEAIRRREEITPELIWILEDTANDPAPYLAEDDCLKHIFALYLLAKFRETRALAPLLRILTLPEQTLDELFGDVVAQDLGRIFLSVGDGADAYLKTLIEDPDGNQWVRTAALDALVDQVAVGQRSREEVMAYFAGLFERLERRRTYVWNALANSCADLCPIEVQNEIRKAYADKLIDRSSIHPDDVRDALARGVEGALEDLRRPGRGFIDDLEKDMDWMAAFHDEPETPGSRLRDLPPEGTYRREAPKVGRNDPCICGSGKKYKKCCGK